MSQHKLIILNIRICPQFLQTSSISHWNKFVINLTTQSFISLYTVYLDHFCLDCFYLFSFHLKGLYINEHQYKYTNMLEFATWFPFSVGVSCLACSVGRVSVSPCSIISKTVCELCARPCCSWVLLVLSQLHVVLIFVL